MPAMHAEVHLFNLTGQPDANVLNNFRQMAIECTRGHTADKNLEEVWHRVQVCLWVQGLFVGVRFRVKPKRFKGLELNA